MESQRHGFSEGKETSLMQLSLVIPVFNESSNLKLFANSLINELDKLNLTYEIILVDDGSEDDSWEVIESMKISSPANVLRPIKLSRNFGQMAAIEAGLRVSKGEYVLTMDADGQHPVDLIPAFWEQRKKTGVVVGQQVQRAESLPKKLYSQLFYRVLRVISGINITPNAGDFRLLSRTVLNELLELPEPKILRFLIPKYGFKVTLVPFEAQSRLTGQSNYTLRKMLRLAVKSIVSTTTKPLHISGIVSVAFLIISILQLAYVLVAWFIDQPISGWTSVMAFASLSFAGVFASLYILGIYLDELISSSNEKSYVVVQPTKD
jgi:glycosyltransferase involved in cell wall biosynthesis